MKKVKLAIVGGGPAGIIAAIASEINSVIILEKTDSLAKKLLLTGGGRCNIANNTSTKDKLKLFKEKNFLRPAFFTLTNEKLLKLFEDKGLNFKIEESNKIFPITNNGNDILDILKSYLKELNIETKLKYKVNSIEKDNKNFIINNEIITENLIIASGGITYPQTGSSGDGYILAEKLNQPLTKIKYGLAPLIVKDSKLNKLSGLKLENVKVKYKKSSYYGDVLISHYGLSGPAILNISNEISNDLNYDLLDSSNINFKNIKISIDLVPSLDFVKLSEKFTLEMDLQGKLKLKNYLKNYLTKNFINYFQDYINLDFDKKLSNISKKEKNKIISSLKNLEIDIHGFKENLSKITIGGVNIKNINSKTMESKITNNLYFAGEILEPAGISGGYNLEIAFKSGYLAGLSVGQNLRNINL